VAFSGGSLPAARKKYSRNVKFLALSQTEWVNNISSPSDGGGLATSGGAEGDQGLAFQRRVKVGVFLS